MILIIFLLLGLIQHVFSIKCFTCTETGFFCPVPLSIDAGEEHNENDISSFQYDSDHVCESYHYIDAHTGQEKIILRGTKSCEELDIANHRRLCCKTDNCNKELPIMTIEPLIYSNEQQYLPSMILILFSIATRIIVDLSTMV